MAVTIEKILFLRQMDFFDGVADDALADLMAICMEKNFKNGEVVAVPEENQTCWYIVLDGILDVFDGDELIDSITPFHPFGEEYVFNPNPCGITAKARGTTVCLTVNKETLSHLLVLHPSLNEVFLARLSQKKS